MKVRHLVGIGLIGAFFLFSAFSFKESLTPYVTFAEARSNAGIVQVKGVLVADSVTASAGAVHFILRDENGEEAQVTYHGVRPEGFEQASSIVAIGKVKNGAFTAEKLLVKCPSKYQGTTQGS